MGGLRRMVKYRCEIRGTCYIEADSEDEALEKSSELNSINWDWGDIDINCHQWCMWILTDCVSE